jgi:hypothetical protein
MISEMRRALSISLILLFSIGPLAALIGDREDSSLPACCRRHGAHHCAITASLGAALAASSGGHVFAAPATCPEFPNAIAATISAPQALVATPFGLPLLLAHLHSATFARTTARMSQIRARDGRSPPSSFLI